LGVSRRQIVNAAGFCMFTDFCVPEEVKIEMIMASTGFKYTRYEEYLLGVRIFTQKHAFNLREGMRKSNWWKLPHRMVTGADYGPLAGIGVDSNLLAYNFFNAIGWDENCVPLRTMLEMTGGLQKVIADLY